MARNNSQKSSPSLGKPTQADRVRHDKVEKALKVLESYGMPPRKATFGLSNNIFPVEAKGGHVRANLSRSSPETLLMDIFDAIWKEGVDYGRAQERDAQTTALLAAFPNLREIMRTVADEAIEADRVQRY